MFNNCQNNKFKIVKCSEKSILFILIIRLSDEEFGNTSQVKLILTKG